MAKSTRDYDSNRNSARETFTGISYIHIHKPVERNLPMVQTYWTSKCSGWPAVSRVPRVL